MWWWWSTVTLAQLPQPVVALGDGLVAGPPAKATAVEPALPGGWVPALADCLEERSPQRFTVVDRAVGGETVATVRGRLAGVRELQPAWVVVTLGAQEIADPAADLKRFRQDLRAVVDELTARSRKSRTGVLLVGLVPPTLGQVEGADPATQDGVDGRTAEWNRAFVELAASVDNVVHVDLWTEWPRDASARAALTVNGWSLSDQGHARVAAAVCDAVIANAGKGPAPESPE